MNDHALPPGADSTAQRAHALHAGARTLIALASQLRRAGVRAPEDVKRSLAAAVARFEHDLAAAGWEPRGVAAASYVLCVWLDEVVADTPWGGGGAGLLQQFHGESDGSARVFKLLSRLAESPQENRALLELFHTCLSLGLAGGLRGTPGGAQQLEALRERVYRALPREAMTLSPPWRQALAGQRPPRPRRVVAAALVGLGVLALALYSAAHLRLASQVDAVFDSMHSLLPAQTPTQAALPAPAPRLTALLGREAAAGALAVRDEAHRSVVTIGADRLFDTGSTRLSRDGTALLARVGQVLSTIDGKVLVIGHTDGSDLRTARLPSAWQQSYEWAQAAAGALGQALPAQRLSAEGAGTVTAAAEASLPRRRVDIVLYP